jgi:hypothetical protein
VAKAGTFLVGYCVVLCIDTRKERRQDNIIVLSEFDLEIGTRHGIVKEGRAGFPACSPMRRRLGSPRY